MSRSPVGVPPAAEPTAPEDVRFVEGLVRVVQALDRERAASLLEGLTEGPRRCGLALLGTLEWTGRGERHAGLIMAFTPRGGAPASAEGIPGSLGVRVRELLARASAESSAPPAMERWARRLALECSAACTGAEAAPLCDSKSPKPEE